MSSEHFFDDFGYDVWGYDRDGHYSSAYDRRPFQASPFPTCAKCDSAVECAGRMAA